MTTSGSTDPAPADSLSGTTPGVQSHVPGEDDTGASVGGVLPDGDAIDHVGDDLEPGVDGASNAGDSVGDDTDPVDDDRADEDPVNGPNETSADND